MSVKFAQSLLKRLYERSYKQFLSKTFQNKTLKKATPKIVEKGIGNSFNIKSRWFMCISLVVRVHQSLKNMFISHIICYTLIL